MKALIYTEFQGTPSVEDVDDPVPGSDGVVLEVGACGICRSDWHGWMGNDPDIVLPHVPGHEIAGIVAEVGKDVRKWRRGDRVTVPFVCGCGKCPECASGNQQVCESQFQPGFTAWGGFAEYVAIERADLNLVRLPDEIVFVDAASLGCRFATSFRAVVDQAKIRAGEWITIFGCGGVGLSAIAIASAIGARTIAVDVSDKSLEAARLAGAEKVLRSGEGLAERIVEITGGGASVTIDAVGSREVVFDAIRSLRRRGRHVQIGLLEAEEKKVPVPMDRVIAWELEILGSHGMQAHRYPEMLGLISGGRIDISRIPVRKVNLGESAEMLVRMGSAAAEGITVIDRFTAA